MYYQSFPHFSHICSGFVCISNGWGSVGELKLPHLKTLKFTFYLSSSPPTNKQSQTAVSATQTRLQPHCKRHPNNCSWFLPERVIFSFSSQAFGPTPISTGPWPQMSVPGDMAANDAPRGAPQSAAYTLFSILQPSNHRHIHNSYTSDSEVYYNPSLTLRVWLYLQLYKNRRMGCLSVPSTYRLSRTLVLHSLSNCLRPAILRQRHALCMSFLHHWSILCTSH